jgi:hypothetical protein
MAMTQITVPDELAQLIVGASPPIVIVDPSGRALGQIGPLTSNTAAQEAISDEEWAEIQQTMANDDGTRYSWAEVKEHLRALARE